jgi:hypothetical protein
MPSEANLRVFERSSSAEPSWRRRLLTACVVLLVLFAVHVTLIVKIDNTNLGTTNGLWKSPSVYQWEHGKGRPVDTGGFLYLPAYGLLCRLVPDSFVSYGFHGQLVTFRKMAILNALFGALASAAVFLLALRFVPTVGPALVVSLAHAAAGLSF